MQGADQPRGALRGSAYTSRSGQDESGIKPKTLRSVDDPLYLLNQINGLMNIWFLTIWDIFLLGGALTKLNADI